MPVPTAVDTQCESCSDPTPEADLVVTADGQQVCEQCLLRFSQCQDCRRHTREITAILDGPDVCQDCADNYDTCDACHSRTRESSAVDNDERVCEDCLDQDYHDCLECSTAIRWDRRYCLACESVYCHDAVHDSDYKPDPTFHGTGPLYLGLELELRTPRGVFGAAVESSINHLGGLGYLKEDGSITNGRGFELVTHPMSYQYAHTQFPWRLLERLRQLGAYTDDEVGIHVHISRAGFTSPAHVYRWLKFVYRNESAVTTLARRASTRWAQFCPNTRKRIGGIVKGEDLFSHRYQAVNTTSLHTFELRVFASSLEPQQVQAALAFADASVEYTRTLTAAQITRHNGWQWNAFVTWLGRPAAICAAAGRTRRSGGARMCLLSFLKPGISPDLDALATGAEANPHGHGYAILTAETILVGRGMNAAAVLENFARVREANPDGPALFHSRLATHGVRDIDNCHPFAVGGDTRTVLAHNGILPENVTPTQGDWRSDTRIAAEDFLPQRPFGSLDSWQGRDRLEKWLGHDKLIILTRDPAYKHPAYIFNEHLGHWHDGRWYSNHSYLAPRYASYPPGFRETDYCTDCGHPLDEQVGTHCHWCGFCLACELGYPECECPAIPGESRYADLAELEHT